jgi:hypothetical protein
MKKTSHRAKIMLLGLCAVLLVMPIGRSDATLSKAALGPEPVFAQTGQPTIRFGENRVADIGGATRHTYTFQANTGDVLAVRVLECADFSCNPSFCPFSPCVELRDEAGLLVNQNCDGSQARITAERLPSSGVHSVIVREDGANDSGRYNLFVQRVNNPGLTESIVSGDNLVVPLNNCGEVDTYTFNARAGDRVKISMVKDAVGNVDPRLELYDSRGRAVAIPNSGSIDQTVTSNGVFTLLAYSSSTQTGTYRLSLTITPAPPTILNVPLVSTGQTTEGVRQTTFVLVNPSEPPARGTLEFFGPDGATPMEVTIRGITDVQFPVSIPAGGVQILETQGTQPLKQGIAKVTTDVGIKAIVILRSVNQMNQTIFEMAYGLPTPTKTLTVPVDSVGANTDTGLILFNPPPFPGEQAQTAMITLRLVARSGLPVGEPVVLSVNAGQLAVGAKGEIIRYLSELFPMAMGIDEFQGTIRITSTADVSVLAVQKRGDRQTIVPGF